jgi:hypothetical protein
LVIEYGFDFDKVALHLYYQFPQYDQRINYKTVTFRWWQITMGEMIEKENNKKDNKQKSEKEQKSNRRMSEDDL